MITILDYGVGNVHSIKNIIRKAGFTAILTSDPEVVYKSSKIILPGVGSYDNAISKLQQSELFDCVNQRVLVEKTPILGVCLGVQLFCQNSEEGKLNGFKWFDASVHKFALSRMGKLKVPHMGWANVHVKKESRLFDNMYENPRFYFVHSYHLICNNPSDVLGTTEHGYEFVSAIENQNIVGVQFHPEKSHKFGLKLYQNFIKNY